MLSLKSILLNPLVKLHNDNVSFWYKEFHHFRNAM